MDVKVDLPPEGMMRVVTDGQTIRLVFPRETDWVQLRLDQAEVLAATILDLVKLVERTSPLFDGHIDVASERIHD